MEERIDKLLVQRNLVSTRTRAEQLIRESGVRVDGALIDKPGKKFPNDCTIELLQEEFPWVSRGALKLLEALQTWNPELTGKILMDVGASTGGFTEVLLTNGVQKVYCIDVGHDQLHEKIKSDSRVINLEKTHVRTLSQRLIPELVDGCVIDVSFISLGKVFPFIHPLIKDEGFVIALVKPQFEVGKANLGKNGIVKQVSLFSKVIEDLKIEAARNCLTYQSHIVSPVLGGDGNREFLMLLKKQQPEG